jgi:hypothetical protein
MSVPESQEILNRLDTVEAKVRTLQRWGIGFIVAGVVALSLTCCGVSFPLISTFMQWGRPPVATTGEPVDANTPLQVGSRVIAKWGDHWWDAEVIGMEPNGHVRIHYTEWESRFDEVVPRDRLRLPADQRLDGQK